MANDSLGSHQAEVHSSIEFVQGWNRELPLRDGLANMYTRFAYSFAEYSKKFDGENNQAGCQRFALGRLM
ncbi:hypothetical protein F441_05259 [Phytophthora nicotianae CJ01A1]|uniref:Uncharacterized protein n=5 Tax=Phytophthora nicotianae TaxID=4792 RepID=W2QEW3_PHYN3|nr:hypothetical protein PPTG_22531 [Phytophthora nicotianae INRA-310]ETL44661.1 hypothetical protein L916_05075 [Phytophthora nicotianae]ETO80134.1 hypothetical protein F444_05298 [Phytophthora nicotianae P1976]ETP21159.1 hypothetical protein F441_05259 [Phytophthora nicotianae CJ01A1]ETP49078.1 hypothetical protein F442_05307 [Phytophthora nicotianae P10297]ETN11738.1 hypothetical protein PPTG_22531 [Phytophthora nicotianae INRA-310]